MNPGLTLSLCPHLQKLGAEELVASLVTEGSPGAGAAVSARGFLSRVHLLLHDPATWFLSELWDDGS